MNLILFSICFIMLVEAFDSTMAHDLVPVPFPESPSPPVEEVAYHMPAQAESIPVGEYGEQVQGHYGGGRGRGGRGGKCKDRRNSYFCEWVAEHYECNDWKMGKKCRKTCGYCTDQECEDFSFTCPFANAFTCSLDWFSRGCKRSCNMCPTETTTTTAPWTTEPETECEDISFNCHLADEYRCTIYWFSQGCKRSCKLCKTPTTTSTTTTTPPTTTTQSSTTTTTTPTTTTPPTTTTQPTTTTPPMTTTPQWTTSPEMTTAEETTSARNCTNDRDDCDTFFKFYCDTPSIRSRCRKFCGACEEETTAPPMTLPPVTAYEETTSPGCTDIRDNCDAFFEWHCQFPDILAQCRKFCGACDKEDETTTPIPATSTDSTTTRTTKRRAKCFTTESTTTTTAKTTTTTMEPTTAEELETTAEMETPEPKPPVRTNPVASTTQPKICEDTDEKNCHTWRSIGLCYSPKFKSDMEVLCPLSCQTCTK